jgi:hypothetical protein
MVNLVFEGAAGGFGGLFQTVPIHVELPTVITAFDSVLPYSTEIERSAAVRAVKSQQSETTAAIAKKHKILAQNPDRGGIPLKCPEPLTELGYGSEAAFELELLIALPQGFNSSPSVRDRDRMPIASQPFTAEGVWTHSR